MAYKGMRYEPATSIIKDLGGAKEVARIAGVHYTRVYRWQLSKDKQGTDGLIPQRHHRVLMQAAKDRGVALTAERLMGLEQGEPV